MKSLSKFIVIVALTLIVGGAAFLTTWEIPAPVTKTEKVLPDARFPR